VAVRSWPAGTDGDLLEPGVECASWNSSPRVLHAAASHAPEHVFRRRHPNEWVDGFCAFLSSARFDALFNDRGRSAHGASRRSGLDIGSRGTGHRAARACSLPRGPLPLWTASSCGRARATTLDPDRPRRARARYEAQRAVGVADRGPTHHLAPCQMWPDPHMAGRTGEVLYKRFTPRAAAISSPGCSGGFATPSPLSSVTRIAGSSSSAW